MEFPGFMGFWIVDIEKLDFTEGWWSPACFIDYQLSMQVQNIATFSW